METRIFDENRLTMIILNIYIALFFEVTQSAVRKQSWIIPQTTYDVCLQSMSIDDIKMKDTKQ